VEDDEVSDADLVQAGNGWALWSDGVISEGKPAGTERTRHSKINRAVAAFLDGCNRQWYGLPTSARLLSAKAGETRKDDQEVWEFRWANGLRGEMRIARSGVLMTLVGAADVDRGGKVTAVHG